MISVAIWQHEREEEVKHDLSFVEAVAGNVGDKPVPKLGQSPGNKEQVISALSFNK